MLKPIPMSAVTLTDAELDLERKEWKRFGPCAVGEKALFLNGRFLERRYYIPVSAISRVYKRVAMSKGGFSGRGVFGSIPYLVVEYDHGKESKFTFKYEEQVDLMLAQIGKRFPQLKRMSALAEAAWNEKQKRIEAKKARIAGSVHSDIIAALQADAAFLNERPELSTELSAAAKAKRVFDRSKPAYKWVALTIVIAGLLSAAYGAVSLINKSGSFGVYFLLFGLAAIFFFSGTHVLPTARSNKKAIEKRLADAIAAMERYIAARQDFPLPARYAHPAVLNRMIEALADDRANSAKAALAVVKEDLKKINSSVTVEQEEYEEIVAIKPMFLVHDYK